MNENGTTTLKNQFPEKTSMDELRKKLQNRVQKAEVNFTPRDNSHSTSNKMNESKQSANDKFSDNSSSKREDSKGELMISKSNSTLLHKDNQNNVSSSTNINNSKIFKIKQKNEKNFKDLNKSLANLASRRMTGRSSSDNDAKIYISNSDIDASNPINMAATNNFEFQPQNSTSINSKTPFNPIKANKAYQTSVQKYFDATPMTYYEGKSKFGDNDVPKVHYKDISLSEIYYDKFQRTTSMYKKNNNVNGGQGGGGNTRNMVCHTEGNTPLLIKPSPQYYNNDDTSNNYEKSINFATTRVNRPGNQYNSMDLYFDGESTSKVTKSDNKMLMRKGTMTTGGGVGGKFITEMDFRKKSGNTANVSVTNPDYDTSSMFTPAFKNNMMPKQTNFIYNLQDRIDRHTKKKLDTSDGGDMGCGNGKPIICITQPQDKSMECNSVSDAEGLDRLNDLNINEGVEYTQGGVGIESTKKERRMHHHNQQGGHASAQLDIATLRQADFDEEIATMKTSKKSMKSHRSTKSAKTTQNPYKAAISYLKKDIMKIKQEMEIRKLSYDEVNKMVKLYETDLQQNKHYNLDSFANSSEKSMNENPNRFSSANAHYPKQSERHEPNNFLTTGYSLRNNNSNLTTANTPRQQTKIASLSQQIQPQTIQSSAYHPQTAKFSIASREPIMQKLDKKHKKISFERNLKTTTEDDEEQKNPYSTDRNNASCCNFYGGSGTNYTGTGNFLGNTSTSVAAHGANNKIKETSAESHYDFNLYTYEGNQKDETQGGSFVYNRDIKLEKALPQSGTRPSCCNVGYGCTIF
jgi:hypothetical protein